MASRKRATSSFILFVSCHFSVTGDMQRLRSAYLDLCSTLGFREPGFTWTCLSFWRYTPVMALPSGHLWPGLDKRIRKLFPVGQLLNHPPSLATVAGSLLLWLLHEITQQLMCPPLCAGGPRLVLGQTSG